MDCIRLTEKISCNSFFNFFSKWQIITHPWNTHFDFVKIRLSTWKIFSGYYRRERNFSQRDLAIQADCTDGMIGQIEAEKSKPSFDMIIRLAALEVHPADLFLMDFLSIISYLYDMKIPVIDIEKTSLNLRQLREDRKVKISRLQTLFNMTNPQSIYNWENPEMKNLPRIDNLVVLAKFYDVKIDDLIFLKDEMQDTMEVSDENVVYGIAEETVSFVKANSSDDVINALCKYFCISI